MCTLNQDYLISWTNRVVEYILNNLDEPHNLRPIAAFMSNNSHFLRHNELIDDQRYYEYGQMDSMIEGIHIINELRETLDNDERLKGLQGEFSGSYSDFSLPLNDSLHLSATYIAQTYLKEYIWNATSAYIDHGLARKMASNMIWSLNTGNTRITFHAILSHLKATACKINDELYIEPGPQKVGSIFSMGSFWYPPEYAIVNHTAELPLVKMQINSILGAGDIGEIPMRKIENAVIALTLLQPGAFSWEGTLVVKAEPGFPGGPLRNFISRTFAISMGPTEYDLPEDKIDMLKQFVAYVENANAVEKFRVAFRRFSTMRHAREDWLLDLCTALENTFGGGSGQAASYKIGMRCARYIGHETSARLTICDDIVKLYNKRSELSHGSSTSETDSDLLKRVESYFRNAHRKLASEFGTNAPTREKFRERLDMLLLENKKEPRPPTPPLRFPNRRGRRKIRGRRAFSFLKSRFQDSCPPP